MKFQKQSVNIWVAIIIVFVLISLMVIYFQTNDSLGVYTDVTTTTATPEESEKPKVELITYQNDELQYSIGIPEGWTKVIKGGYETYIHSTGTSIQIQLGEFSVGLLNATAETMKDEISKAGYKFTKLQWVTNSSYTLVYEEIPQFESDTPTSLHYAEATFFDFQKMIRLVYTVENRYSEQLNNEMIAIFDSFKWDGKGQIPSGVWFHYSSYGNYRFATPDGWKVIQSSNTYIAQDPKTGTQIIMSATQSTADYDKLTQADYIAFASKGRENFALNQFVHEGDTIFGNATYTANNTPMLLIQYLIASGKYEYSLTFEVPQSAFSSHSALFQDIVNSFVYY